MGRALLILVWAAGASGAAPARADDEAPAIVVVFEATRSVDADGLRRRFTSQGIRAVGVADEAAIAARETLTIVFARDGRTATAWLRSPRGSEQRTFVAPRRDVSGRWVITPAAALVHDHRAGSERAAAMERAATNTEVLDPWSSRAPSQSMHRIPLTEVLDPWAASPRRPRPTRIVIRPIASPEVIDPWRDATVTASVSESEVLDPWSESGTRLAPPRGR